MIDEYEFGKIVVKGVSYDRDIIIYPDHVDKRWWRKEGHRLAIDDLSQIIEFKPEVLVVGTGYYGTMKVPEETRKFIESKGIELIIKETREACKVYNTISSKKKAVAALHLTC